VTYKVHFKGGELGGETQTWSEYPPRRIRWPVLGRVGGFSSETGTLPLPMPEDDVYYFARQSSNGQEFFYRWDRPPIETMRHRIDCLLARVEELEKPQPRAGLMRFSR
jgi:hypothetical protein